LGVLWPRRCGLKLLKEEGRATSSSKAGKGVVCVDMEKKRGSTDLHLRLKVLEGDGKKEKGIRRGSCLRKRGTRVGPAPWGAGLGGEGKKDSASGGISPAALGGCYHA